MRRTLLLCVGMSVAILLRADSPLTSTFFAKAYQDIPAIERLLKLSETNPSLLVVDKEVLEFLDATNHGWDQKIAMVNALGWGSPSNTNIYCEHLVKKYQISRASVDSLLNGSIESLNEESASPLNFTGRVINDADLLVLAYLQAMGDYFQPIISINIIDHVFTNNPTSQATALVGSLIAAQFLMDIDWCAVSHCTDVLYEPGYDRDLVRIDALKSVEEYMDLYNLSCIEVPEPAQIAAGEDALISPAIIEDGRVFDLNFYQTHCLYNKPTERLRMDKKNYVDLNLLTKVNKKEMALYNWVHYNEEFNGTELQLTIKNDGTINSIETNALIRIAADHESGETRESYFQKAIPVIEPGETIYFNVVIPGYWIYDPNAEFSIELDFDNMIEEKDENNNVLNVFEWG
jgi:CARDB